MDVIKDLNNGQTFFKLIGFLLEEPGFYPVVVTQSLFKSAVINI